MADDLKRRLKSIKSGAFSRGFALARVSMAAGAKAASHAVGTIFTHEDDRAERIKALLSSQMELLTKELGQLKGSVMKMGQMLSMVGEQILPPEANAFLKTLQSESPALEWAAVEKQLKRQLGAEPLAGLEIDQEPWGSASLGQVHRATIKATGEKLALKIQYPGVDESVESDLTALKRLLTLAKLIPKTDNYEELFKEVRQMLHQEVDYERERASTDEFRELLAGDLRYIVPRTFEAFSSKRVLATSFEEGHGVDSPEVRVLSEARRNALGLAFIDLYFRELLEFRAMQTDPHFGNYRIRIGTGPCGTEGGDQWVLFDFGAVRKITKSFLESYLPMIEGTLHADAGLVEKGGVNLGFLVPEDSLILKQTFVDLCMLFGEPFFESLQPYAWGESDLPKRVIAAGKKMALDFHLRAPPREIVFLDRKMGGVFIVLSKLRARVDARPLLAQRLKLLGK